MFFFTKEVPPALAGVARLFGASSHELNGPRLAPRWTHMGHKCAAFFSPTPMSLSHISLPPSLSIKKVLR